MSSRANPVFSAALTANPFTFAQGDELTTEIGLVFDLKIQARTGLGWGWQHERRGDFQAMCSKWRCFGNRKEQGGASMALSFVPQLESHFTQHEC